MTGTNLTLDTLILTVCYSIILGTLLSIATKKFKVFVDERIEKVSQILPQVNCGACGYPNCDEYAKALVEENAEIDKCVVCGSTLIDKIAGILKKEVKEKKTKVAVILCQGGDNCKDRFSYLGFEDCWIANLSSGGQKYCESGCIGLGSCAKVCKFNAIRYDYGKVPKINSKLCTGCGECVKTCPKNLIKLVECKFQYHILCNSTQKPSFKRKICVYPCIGCKICVKICRRTDIDFKDNIALMKYLLCNNCGLCFKNCPTKAISSLY